MADTVQMNTRINRNLKLAGDSVLRHYGYSPSSAIQMLWTYLAENSVLPDFMPIKESTAAKEEKRQEIQASKGMATRMLCDLTGTAPPSYMPELSIRDLKELGWEDEGVFDERLASESAG